MSQNSSRTALLTSACGGKGPSSVRRGLGPRLTCEEANPLKGFRAKLTVKASGLETQVSARRDE